MVSPAFLDAQGNRFPDDAAGELVAQSIYDIPIKGGVLFQPHPAFARHSDDSFVYYPLKSGELDGKFGIPDFQHTGTRELTADDYVYAFRRLASPRVVSPIFSVLADHVVGMRAYGEVLRERDRVLRKGSASGSLPWMDLREPDGFTGV